MQKTDILNHIERKFPVSEWQLGSTYIWPIVRFSIGKEIDQKKRTRRPANLLFWFFPCLMLIVLIATRVKKYNVQNHGEVLLFPNEYHDYNVKGKKGNYYFDKFSEKFAEKNITYATVEHTGWRRLTLDEAKEIYLEVSRLRLGFLREINKELHAIAGQRFSSVSQLSIRLKLAKYCIYYRDFEKLLLSIKPSSILSTSVGRIERFAFYAAANSTSIPCVYVQGGLQGVDNVHIGKWEAPGAGFYQMIPKNYWLWDEATYGCFSAREQVEHVFLGGNPSILTVIENNKTPSLESSFASPTARLRLGYLHQPTVPIPYEVLARLSVNYEIAVRLHPAVPTVPSDLKRLAASDFKIELSTERTLDQFFSSVSFLLTGYSAAAQQGLAASVGVILHDVRGKALFSSLITANLCFFADNAESITECVYKMQTFEYQERLRGYVEQLYRVEQDKFESSISDIVSLWVKR